MSERDGRAVLIIDDETSLARNLATFLARQGWETRTAESAEDGLAIYPEFRPDLVLLDHNLPGMDGLQALALLRGLDPDCQVVMMTGFGSVDLAVSALKGGAKDYLSKPLALGELRLLLERLTGQERLKQAVHYYAGRQAASSGLDKVIGQSPPMRQLRERITQLLASERQLREGEGPAVLVHGETGTGKELVARALHFDGPRRDGPFVELNCGALPAQLVEAELFGYERGAFTDARQRKVGLVETAEGGTLFLDEIGEADAATQVKLLKLLEDRRFRRLGGLRDQAVDVRIVSATHQPLEAMVAAGRFRADLYYRLRIVEVTVPPLRARGDDVLLLARHFLAHHAQRYRRGPMQLDQAAEVRLRQHHWPGNVRELRNLMEQAVLLSAGPLVTEADLAGLSAQRGAPAGGALAPDADLNLERAERRLVEAALQRSDGNVTQAARLLGISRDTLRYRLERLGIRSGEASGA